MRILTAKTARELSSMRERLDAAEKKASRLESLIIDDVDRAQASTVTYTGNAYKTYKEIIDELAKKYEAKADWGNVQAGNIVDIRAAFIIGQGLNIGPANKETKSDPKTIAALDFARAFMEFNDLDREGVQELAKEAEIEGCFLGALRWDKDGKQVSIRFKSRVETKYDIICPADDYRWYQRAEWKEGSSYKKLEAPEFVYARFGGRIHKPNEPTPKTGKCLTEIEGLSKALRDWREINRLFGSPVPTIQCDTPEQATFIKNNIKDIQNNWKLRRVVVTTGKLAYVSPDSTAQAGIEREIITLVKMISGATGVPIHFLGMPGELNGRATADNLMELVGSSTQKERLIWTGAWQEVIEKAAAIWNQNSKLTPIKPELVKVSIPAVSPETWARLADVWTPLYTAGAISLQTVLEQIPGIDAGEEQERIASEKEANMARFAKNLPAGGDEEGEDDKDEEELIP